MLVTSCLLSNLFSAFLTLLCTVRGRLLKTIFLMLSGQLTSGRFSWWEALKGEPAVGGKTSQGIYFPSLCFRWPLQQCFCSCHSSSSCLTYLPFTVSAPTGQPSPWCCFLLGSSLSLSWGPPALKLLWLLALVLTRFSHHRLLGFSVLPMHL